MLARLVALAAAAGASKIFGAAPGAPDSIMDDSSGTYCVGPVQEQLRWNVDQDLAERIACHNRRYAERAGYWRGDDLTFLAEAAEAEELEFFDSVTGKLLFVAPRGRTMAEFLDESLHHGWPSFRDEETIVENVRVVEGGDHRGELVSVDGTHLGHNIPDDRNRYCVDLVSVAGRPLAGELPSTMFAGSVAAGGCGGQVAVYLGNGCFWHTQYDFSSSSGRALDEVTARVGYAGGVGGSPDNLVCYYRGPPKSYYGDYDYAEVVEVLLDEADALDQFAAIAESYFVEGFMWYNGQWTRKDPQDRGLEYRNAVGVPGGLRGPYGAALRAANVNGMELVEDNGGIATYLDQGPVYVYDADLYPFFVGEQYHQFHKNTVTGRYVEDEYLVDARAAAKDRGWIYEVCSEPGSSGASNLGECSTGLPDRVRHRRGGPRRALRRRRARVGLRPGRQGPVAGQGRRREEGHGHEARRRRGKPRPGGGDDDDDDGLSRKAMVAVAVLLVVCALVFFALGLYFKRILAQRRKFAACVVPSAKPPAEVLEIPSVLATEHAKRKDEPQFALIAQAIEDPEPAPQLL
ncbi:hypothetical protein JL720_4650 [Aureococcus anophagefferens]|nr:hypothetical protein JL720_4650 [Aureococcus anophagefferens]